MLAGFNFFETGFYKQGSRFMDIGRLRDIDRKLRARLQVEGMPFGNIQTAQGVIVAGYIVYAVVDRKNIQIDTVAVDSLLEFLKKAEVSSEEFSSWLDYIGSSDSKFMKIMRDAVHNAYLRK